MESNYPNRLGRLIESGLRPALENEDGATYIVTPSIYEVWRKCDGDTSPGDIGAVLTKESVKSAVIPADIKAYVDLIIDSLSKKKLVDYRTSAIDRPRPSA